jgi:hypothetical protein
LNFFGADFRSTVTICAGVELEFFSLGTNAE